MLNTLDPARTGHDANHSGAGRGKRPLRVAVLCSQRSPGLAHLLTRTLDRGVAFEIVCAISSELTFDEEILVERRGIPTRPHPIAGFYQRRGASVFRSPAVRADYDAVTVEILRPYRPDLLLLAGYRYLVTPVLLEAYDNRILNLHFSDLTLRATDGSPLHPGIRAVRDAIADGCPETRACVHLVNEEPDGGPVLVRSWGFPVSPMVEDLRASAPDALKAYVFAHERWMMRTASGPMLAAALRLVAGGVVDLDRLGSAAAVESVPWTLSQRGSLTAPELESA